MESEAFGTASFAFEVSGVSGVSSLILLDVCEEPLVLLVSPFSGVDKEALDESVSPLLSVYEEPLDE